MKPATPELPSIVIKVLPAKKFRALHCRCIHMLVESEYDIHDAIEQASHDMFEEVYFYVSDLKYADVIDGYDRQLNPIRRKLDRIRVALNKVNSTMAEIRRSK